MKISISILNALKDETFFRRLPLLIGRGLVESKEVLDLGDYDPERMISQQHCEIFMKDSSLFICDLESKNGTYLFWAGKLSQIPSGSPHPISVKDIFVVGHLLLRIEEIEKEE